MQAKFRFIREERWLTTLAVLTMGATAWLMLYRLGSLVGGLSNGEHQIANTVYGWHGLWRQPLYLPLSLVRSVVFAGFRHHGLTLTRLPNALFGALTIVSFGTLLRLWYGGRTALLTAILFACSAWTLHVSRLASNDVLYLWATPTVLLIQLAIQRRGSQMIVFYVCLVAWLTLLFVPGFVYILLLTTYWNWRAWWQIWLRALPWWQRGVAAVIGLLGSTYLIVASTRPGNLRLWLGLPIHFSARAKLLRQFGAVPFHLLGRGPDSATLWLGRAPILDVFTLVMTVIGVYFYARHWRVSRSRQLAGLFLVSWVLVAIGGPVVLSLLVPLLYICAAAGIAYLLREWLQVFPRNPLARGLGISLIVLAVGLSAGYNLRAYFVAWPLDPSTRAVFRDKG
jgi:hypothetical protein